MAVLMPLNPDVIFFQEACILSYGPSSPDSPNWWDHLPPNSPRVAALHAALRSAGYSIVEADGCQNPAMLATRLPITHVQPSFVIDTHPYRGVMLAQQPPELRSARLVVLRAGHEDTSPEFVAVVSHLNHKETHETLGLRLAEVRTITQQLHAVQQYHPRAAVVFAADFNCPRRRDYSQREWTIVAHMKRKLGEVETDARGSCAHTAPPLLPSLIGPQQPSTSPIFASRSAADGRDGRGALMGGTHPAPKTSTGCWYLFDVVNRYMAAQRDVDALSDHLPLIHDFNLVRFPE